MYRRVRAKLTSGEREKSERARVASQRSEVATTAHGVCGMRVVWTSLQYREHAQTSANAQEWVQAVDAKSTRQPRRRSEAKRVVWQQRKVVLTATDAEKSGRGLSQCPSDQKTSEPPSPLQLRPSRLPRPGDRRLRPPSALVVYDALPPDLIVQHAVPLADPLRLSLADRPLRAPRPLLRLAARLPGSCLD